MVRARSKESKATESSMCVSTQNFVSRKNGKTAFPLKVAREMTSWSENAHTKKSGSQTEIRNSEFQTRLLYNQGGPMV